MLIKKGFEESASFFKEHLENTCSLMQEVCPPIDEDPIPPKTDKDSTANKFEYLKQMISGIKTRLDWCKAVESEHSACKNCEMYMREAEKLKAEKK
jgi:hypothetical protein